MGVSVNCRFLCDTTFDALKNFCSASLNLLAYKDYTESFWRISFPGNTAAGSIQNSSLWLRRDRAVAPGRRRFSLVKRTQRKTSSRTTVRSMKPGYVP